MARRSTGWLVATTAAAALVLSACGGGGGAGNASGGGSGAASAGGQGNFLFAKLAFNEQIFAAQGTAASGPMFDQAGNALDAADPATPNGGKPGVVSFQANGESVPFEFPGTTGNTSVMVPNAGEADITVPAGKYKEIYFLEGVGNGTANGATMDLTLKYSDGSTDQPTLLAVDWTLQQNAAGNEAIAFTNADYVQAADGSLGTSAHGMNVAWVPANPAKTLTAVDIVNDSANNAACQFNVAALTLEK